MVLASNYEVQRSCDDPYHVNGGDLDSGMSDCYYFLKYLRWAQMWAMHGPSPSLVHNFSDVHQHHVVDVTSDI